MTQEATVSEILEDGYAMVAVKRQSACGGNCKSCGACMYSRTLTVKAKNNVSADVGDEVLIKSSSADVLGLAALVYLLPLVTLFIGYLLGGLVSQGEAVPIIGGLLGLCIGVALTVFISKRRKGDETVGVEIIEVR